MKTKTIIYCAANLVTPDSAPLTLALVQPDARWHYIEIIDQAVEDVDDVTNSLVLPKLKRIPGTRFIRSTDLVSDLASFFGGLGTDTALEFRFLRGRQKLVTQSLQQALKMVYFQGRVKFSDVEMNKSDFDQFQRHCGGRDRVRQHALTDAIGAALCDRASPGATSFHLAPIHHLELLLGSKNATSFRAWARTRSKDVAMAEELAPSLKNA